MDASDLTIEQQQKIVFFREYFNELYTFITNGNITKSTSMDFLLDAYDLDTPGREKMAEKMRKESPDMTDESIDCEVEKKYKKSKEECWWHYKNNMITKSDLRTAIEAFFELTQEKSDFLHEGESEYVNRLRKMLFDTYFQLLQVPKDTISVKDFSLFGNFKCIFVEEGILGAIMKRFGIIDDFPTGTTIGTLEYAYSDFCYKEKPLEDETCNYVNCYYFSKCFDLYRVLRNAYLHVLKDDETLLSDAQRKFLTQFSYRNAKEAIKFDIFFYVALICLLNKVWKNETAKKKLQDDKNNPLYKCPQLFEATPLKASLKVDADRGSSCEWMKVGNGSMVMVNAEVNEFGLSAYGVFPFQSLNVEVKYSSKQNVSTYKITLDERCWEDTTIVLAQGRQWYPDSLLTGNLKPVHEYADTKDTTPTKQGVTVETSNPIQTTGAVNKPTSPTAPLVDVPAKPKSSKKDEGIGAISTKREYVSSVEEVKKKSVETGSPLTYEESIDGVLCRFVRMEEDMDLIKDKLKLSLKMGVHFDFEFYSLYKVIKSPDYFTPFHVPEYLTLPKGKILVIKAIGPSAFEGTGFGHIILPNSIKSIGKRAFALCRDLSVISFGDGVEEIGEGAFHQCGRIRHIVLPRRLRAISPGLFTGCTLLEEVKLSEGITEVGDDAFRGCGSLRFFNMPCVNGKRIGDRAFMGCRSLREIVLPDRLEYGIGTSAFRDCVFISKIVIPSSVNTIKNSTFEGCRALKKVTMKDQWGLKICSRAFAGCTGLETICFEDTRQTVNEVESEAFEGCFELKTFGGMPISEACDHYNRACASVIMNDKPIGSCIADDAFEPSVIKKTKKSWFSF